MSFLLFRCSINAGRRFRASLTLRASLTSLTAGLAWLLHRHGDASQNLLK